MTSAGVTLGALIGVLAAVLKRIQMQPGPSGGQGWSAFALSHDPARAGILLLLALLAAGGPVLIRFAGVPQAVAGFGVLLLAPGAALLGFAAIRDLLTELVLGFALSVTVVVLLSGLLLLIGGGHSTALFIGLAVLSAPVLAWHGASSLAPPDPTTRRRS